MEVVINAPGGTPRLKAHPPNPDARSLFQSLSRHVLRAAQGSGREIDALQMPWVGHAPIPADFQGMPFRGPRRIALEAHRRARNFTAARWASREQWEGIGYTLEREELAEPVVIPHPAVGADEDVSRWGLGEGSVIELYHLEQCTERKRQGSGERTGVRPGRAPRLQRGTRPLELDQQLELIELFLRTPDRTLLAGAHAARALVARAGASDALGWMRPHGGFERQIYDDLVVDLGAALLAEQIGFFYTGVPSAFDVHRLSLIQRDVRLLHRALHQAHAASEWARRRIGHRDLRSSEKKAGDDCPSRPAVERAA